MKCQAKLVFDAEAEFPIDELGRSLAVAIGQQGLGPSEIEARSSGLEASAGAHAITLDIQRDATATYLVIGVFRPGPEAQPVKKLLAGITRTFALNQAPGSVVWLETEVPLPRDAFLEAFAPDAAPCRPVRPRRVDHAEVPVEPRHVLPEIANTGVPPRALRADAHVRAYEKHLREVLRRPATPEELEELREAAGIQPTTVRLSTWAMSLAVASISLPVAAPVIVHNLVKGEDFRFASLAMGLSGLFVALDTTGAMADIVTNL